MSTLNRRYDIDWVRVIAIGLLLIYHVAIGFQPWGIMIQFITNDTPWNALWTPMTMLNIWRIPLLFFVSGMGVYFALQNRNLVELLQERATRILLPLVFGMLVIFPVSTYIWKAYYHFDQGYAIHPGHLWFLANIFGYVVLLSPLFYYLKRNEQGKAVGVIRAIFSNPLGLLVVIGAFITEALLVNPNPYEFYVLNWHGFFLGLLAFFFGFCFVLSGDRFWSMMLKWRWLFIAVAVSLFIYRLNQFQMRVPSFHLAIESNLWIFSMLAFAYRYLNRSSKTLRYLSEAAYPIYILHMIFLFLGSMVIFPLAISVYLKFIAVLVFTFVGCFATYELIRRINFIRPLFGLKRNLSLTVHQDSPVTLKSVN
jgi:glucans biosynthesis protein C